MCYVLFQRQRFFCPQQEFLACLPKGHVSFCHHLASLSIRSWPSTVSYSPLKPLGRKEPNLTGGIYGRSFKNFPHFIPIRQKKISCFWLADTLKIFSFETAWPNGLIFGMEHVWKVLYKYISLRPDLSTNMASMDNYCFWSADTLKSEWVKAVWSLIQVSIHKLKRSMNTHTKSDFKDPNVARHLSLNCMTNML